MAKNRVLYDRLGIDENATDTQIREAYDKAIAACPPSSALYTEIEEAYAVLGNIEKRAKYDITGEYSRKRGSRNRASLDSIGKARKILNTIFMIGAVATILLYFMKTEDHFSSAFFIVGISSLVIKIVEFILRLLP